jgi:hypothetical protein
MEGGSSPHVECSACRLLRRRVDAATGTITTVAGNGTRPALYAGGVAGGDGKLATAAAVGNPTGVEVDAAGNIYIAEPNTNLIRRVDAASRVISTFAGSGQFVNAYSGDGGSARDANLNYPTGVALTRGGQIVIADNGNHVVRVVNCSSPSGAPSRPALGLRPQASCHCQR